MAELLKVVFYSICLIHLLKINANLNSYDYMPTIWKQPRKRLAIAPRIVGGLQASQSDFPFQVALIIYLKLNSLELCGGSLISSNYILTAAHCLDEAIAARILLGANSLRNASQISQQFFVNSTAFTIHPNWEPDVARNDIALIKLPESVEFSENIQVVNLPNHLLEQADLENRTAIASGWGQFSDDLDAPSTVLRYTEVTVISQEECNYYFAPIVTSTNICTNGLDGKGTCSGDSGGPLILESEVENSTIIGITSFGLKYGCELGFPSVFTKVSSYLSWIVNETGIIV